MPTENPARHTTSDFGLSAPLSPRPGLQLIVFDFDGTLSWLRHGWPGMMLAAARPAFSLRPGETEAALHSLLLDEILALNGQPSLRQCERLAALAAERHGATLDAAATHANFQARLDAAIERRSARISSGSVPADAYLIRGARAFLEHIAARGLTPVILSSTVQHRVEAEAALLGIAHFFGPRIYGSDGHSQGFSKRAVFERLLREGALTGEQLLSFGDGPTEIRDTVALGGCAVGLCSDEDDNSSGAMDERKRAQLLAAGARAALPDFCHAAPLLDALFEGR